MAITPKGLKILLCGLLVMLAGYILLMGGGSGFIMSKFLEEYKEQRTVEERLADLEKRVALLEEGK